MKKIIFVFISCLALISSSSAKRIDLKEEVINIQSAQTIKSVKKNVSKSETIDKDIIIDEKDKTCTADIDCAVVSVRCGDCGLDTVNKSHIEKYKSELEHICRDHKEACDTDYRSTHEIKCIDLKCKLVPR